MWQTGVKGALAPLASSQMTDRSGATKGHSVYAGLCTKSTDSTWAKSKQWTLWNYEGEFMWKSSDSKLASALHTITQVRTRTM